MRTWFRRSALAPVAQAYLDATSPTLGRQALLEELKFVVIDTEASGLDARRNELLSLAIVPIEKGQIHLAQIKSWVVYQSGACLNEAVQVHGIFPAETACGQPEAEMLAELLPLISGAVLVGHHLGFDAAILDAALKRHYQIGLRNPLLDTAELAMRTLEAFRRTHYPAQRPPSLDELCSYCGLEPIERHTAEGDAFTTAELFLVLIARLQKIRGGVLKTKELPLDRV